MNPLVLDLVVEMCTTNRLEIINGYLKKEE